VKLNGIKQLLTDDDRDEVILIEKKSFLGGYRRKICRDVNAEQCSLQAALVGGRALSVVAEMQLVLHICSVCL